MTTKLSEYQENVIKALADGSRKSAKALKADPQLVEWLAFSGYIEFGNDGLDWGYVITALGVAYARENGWETANTAEICPTCGGRGRFCSGACRGTGFMPVSETFAKTEKVLVGDVKVGDVLISEYVKDKTVSQIIEKPTTRFGQQSRYDLKFMYAEGGSDLWYDTDSVIRMVKPAQEAQQSAPDVTTGDFDLLAMGNVSEGEEVIKTSDIQEGDLVFYRDWREVAYIEHMQNGWTRIMDTHGDTFTSETKSGIRRLVAVLSVSIPVRSTPQAIPAAQFTDHEQLATFARERKHGGAYAMDGVENILIKDVVIGDEVFFSGWCTVASIEHQAHGWTYFVDTNGKSFPLPTLGTINRRVVTPAISTDSTPLSVLREAIKALTGVNDPSLRTRDCVERTERALGLLVDELLPKLEAQNKEIERLTRQNKAMQDRVINIAEYDFKDTTLGTWLIQAVMPLQEYNERRRKLESDAG